MSKRNSHPMNEDTIVQIMADERGGISGNLEPDVWHDYVRTTEAYAKREAEWLERDGNYKAIRLVDWISKEPIDE